MRLRSTVLYASFAVALIAMPASVAASPYVDDRIVVGFDGGRERVIDLDQGTSLAEGLENWRGREGVRFAVADPIARAAAVKPIDAGTSGSPGGWRADQWSFLSRPGGIRVEGAWNRLAAAGVPGAAGTTVAVVDSGVAYTSTPEGGAGAPDFGPDQFVPGIDVVDDDSRPLDENGHGTHVAATIGEQITLAKQPPEEHDYLTGLAYGAKLMPVRVLDSGGEGAATDVAEGILWAARNGADVINVSLQFDPSVTSCAQVPTVCEAVRKAKRRGALLVAAAGNALAGNGRSGALFPAAAPGVLGVGATTEHGCIADYSHFGGRVDLVAPGGGKPRPGAIRSGCADDERPILQLTLDCFPGSCGLGSYGRFGIRADTGTSMASAHVSAVAAMVIAAGTAGDDPKPAQVARRLKCTALKLKPKRYFRGGMLDAVRAVRPKVRCR